MHLLQVEHYEVTLREGERVDLMLKIARATAVGVYGKESASLMEDTVNDYLRRIDSREAPAPDGALGEQPSRLLAELKSAEAAFADFDETLAKRATVIYVPPPVGSVIQSL